MKSPIRKPRKPNLATIVGSGLALVAAGSLLAFSSLAEQARLEGLATRGLQPAAPARYGNTVPAITLPAPSTPAEGRGGLLDELLEEGRTRVAAAPQQSQAVTLRAAAPDQPRPKKPNPPAHGRDRDLRPDERRVLARAAAPPGNVGAEWDGDDYDEREIRGKKPKKPKKPHPHKGPRKHDPAAQPVYARSTADEDDERPSKPPKMKKVKKAADGHGNKARAQGRGEDHDEHDGKGRGKGHAKHDGKGRGKGHSKHGG